MTTHEIPHSENEPTANSHDKERVNRDQWIKAADLIENIGDLVVALRNDRMPDYSEYDFMFSGEKLDTMFKPERVKEMIPLYGELDEVMIFTKYLEGYHSSSITIHYHFLDDNGNLTLLTVDRPGYHKDSHIIALDHVYENVYTENSPEKVVKPITSVELSRCVASLIYPPNKEGDWSGFDGVNFNDYTIYEPVVDSLQKHARNYSGNELFELTPLSSTKSGRLNFTVDNGELISAELQIVKDSDIQMQGDEPVSVEHIFATEIDLSSGAAIDFIKIDQIEDNQTRTRIEFPEADDYMAMIEFAKHHIGQADPADSARSTEISTEAWHNLTDEDLS